MGKQEELKAEIEELQTRVDEIKMANAISNYMDVEMIKNGPSGSFVNNSRVELYGENAFDKLLKILPEKSYLCGDVNGGWGHHMQNRYQHRKCILLLDEKIALLIGVRKKYCGNCQKQVKVELILEAYKGDDVLNINVENGASPSISYVSVVESGNNCRAQILNIDGDYSSYNGKKLVDVIGIVDLANFVKKDGEDYQFQKVKQD